MAHQMMLSGMELNRKEHRQDMYMLIQGLLNDLKFHPHTDKSVVSRDYGIISVDILRELVLIILLILDLHCYVMIH